MFCRQWNWTFGGGSVVPRTLKVFNDTHLSDPIEMTWQLRLGDRPAAGEQKVYQLAPGQHEEVQISVAVPQVSQRTWSGDELVMIHDFLPSMRLISRSKSEMYSASCRWR